MRRPPIFVVLILVLITASAIARHHHPQVPDNPAFTRLADVLDERITESSGIAQSISQPDAIWVHNDSGDKPRLFLVGLDGETRCVVTIRTKDPADWEDMCSFRANDANWLLIADVGDNAERRGNDGPPCRLLIVPEPEIDWKGRELVLSTSPVLTIEFGWEDGPRNCESVAVDTETHEILLVTKTKPSEAALYTIPLNLTPGTLKATARRVCRAAIPFATAMDVSTDGRKMVVTTMISAVLVNREADETWADAWKKPLTVVTIPPQKQCETICFLNTGTEVLVHSEGNRQTLWKIQLAEKPSPPVRRSRSPKTSDSETNQ
ncbi:MAG: hypothetical protein JNL58_21315 [Planctomyces sp.]|nr:hypothetical protein [Planctomyces sp.]